MATGRLGGGLYGTNGHQILNLLVGHARARLAATVAIDPSRLPEKLRGDADVRHFETLDDMLKDERVDLVSLCSPRRRDQAHDAIRCLEAGRHVYAEKPCAMTEEDLDAIVEAAGRAGREFHEMAGTAFAQPYLAMRELVKAGTIGEVVQVFAQKSYPYHDRRPQDEDVDAGLIRQAAVHALRMIEHVAWQRVAEVKAFETTLGNPVSGGGLRMAASIIMRLESGGLAAVVANYLNPRGFGRWGNEHLRIFGTLGFVEATDGGTRTRLVVGEEDRGAIDVSRPGRDYFDMLVDLLLDGKAMPLSLEEELHPTRVVIRAKRSASG